MAARKGAWAKPLLRRQVDRPPTSHHASDTSGTSTGLYSGLGGGFDVGKPKSEHDLGTVGATRDPGDPVTASGMAHTAGTYDCVVWGAWPRQCSRHCQAMS
jgi:hypothetical protein